MIIISNKDIQNPETLEGDMIAIPDGLEEITVLDAKAIVASKTDAPITNYMLCDIQQMLYDVKDKLTNINSQLINLDAKVNRLEPYIMEAHASTHKLSDQPSTCNYV